MEPPWIIFALGALLGLCCVPIALLVVRLGRQARALAAEFRQLSSLARPAQGVTEGSRLLRHRSAMVVGRTPLEAGPAADGQPPHGR